MGFEKFSKQSGYQRSTDPKISLRRTSTIGINATATQEFFQDTDAVTLFFDEETNRVGIQPADSDDADSYVLQGQDNSNSRSINASAFMNRYDLVPEITTHYEPIWDDDAELVTIDLDEPIGTYGSSDNEDE